MREYIKHVPRLVVDNWQPVDAVCYEHLYGVEKRCVGANGDQRHHRTFQDLCNETRKVISTCINSTGGITLLVESI